MNLGIPFDTRSNMDLILLHTTYLCFLTTLLCQWAKSKFELETWLAWLCMSVFHSEYPILNRLLQGISEQSVKSNSALVGKNWGFSGPLILEKIQFYILTEGSITFYILTRDTLYLNLFYHLATIFLISCHTSEHLDSGVGYSSYILRRPQFFCKISTVDLSYVVTVKSTVEISKNFVALSEYMNFE